MRRFGRAWSENFLANLAYLPESADVGGLFGLFKGETAIIVSAGPSLSKNVHLLRRRPVADSAVIICADTAYKVLKASGIQPHLLVCVSGNPLAYKKLEGSGYDIPLVYKSQSAHMVLSNHNEKKFYARYINSFLDEALAAAGKYPGFIDSGGSVSCSCLDLAVKMGFSNVIFIGQDFALTGGKTHAEHAEHFMPNGAPEKFIVETSDIYGNTIKTLINLNTYRRWFEKYIKNCTGVRFIDATEGGALIDGTEVMTLSDSLDIFLSKGINIGSKITEAFSKNQLLTKETAKTVAGKYENAYNDFLRAKELLADIINEYEAGPVSYGRVSSALDALYSYTSAISYSILTDIYDAKNMNIGAFPESELAIFRKMSGTLDSLAKYFMNAVEVK